MTTRETSTILDVCKACGKPLLLANALVDDGCPCNSPRGVNLTPRECSICMVRDCVKPAHHSLRDILLGEVRQ